MRQHISILGILMLLGPIVCMAGGGGRIDYSQLPYEQSVIKIIEQNVPLEFEEFYRDWSSPDMLWTRICAKYYENGVHACDSTILLLFYGSLKHGVFKVISAKTGASYGKTICETDSVFGEANVEIVLCDIDCDSINEILLYSNSGMASIRTLCIVKPTNDEIHILRPSPDAVTFEGRMVELDKSGTDCPKPIKVFVDGPVKYQPDTVKTYQFDAAKQSYQLESVKVLPKREK
jgi:hypothetical protein